MTENEKKKVVDYEHLEKYTKYINSLIVEQSGGGSSIIPDEPATPGDQLYVKEVDDDGKPTKWAYVKPSSVEVYDTESRTEYKSYTGTLNGYNFLDSDGEVEHTMYRSDSSTILFDDVSHALNINDSILITSDNDDDYAVVKRVDNEKITIKFFVDKELSLEKELLVYEKPPVTVYGFHINSNESNPSNAVTYLADAVGMTPAYMDYTNDKFNYGSWEGAFFMPRPCMLNADGTVAYYLNPNDYTKKIDGTASDIDGSGTVTHSMNAMMEWGTGGKKIWVKKVADADDSCSVSVYISDSQIDEDYHAWSFIGTDGTLKEHFYTPIYNGSEISGKLRSLSGTILCKRKGAKAEIDLATANGSGWFTEVFCDIDLINDLLVLISKTLDTQTAFGTGNIKSGQGEADMLISGQINKSDTEYLANKKGLFYGGNDQLTVVKVFGMENWWGNQWRRFAGMINDNGNIKIKKCYGTSDGSSVQSYGIPTDNSSAVANGYIATGITPSGSSGGGISKIDYSTASSIPSVSSGSTSTYYCDGYWFNNGQVDYAIRGGFCGNGFRCGGFFLFLNYVASYSYWDVGAALSFKMP